jgi:hypothetical protein
MNTIMVSPAIWHSSPVAFSPVGVYGLFPVASQAKALARACTVA